MELRHRAAATGEFAAVVVRAVPRSSTTGRQCLAHAQCDAVNAILAAAGCHPSPAQVAEGIFVADDRRASDPTDTAHRLKTQLFTIDVFRAVPEDRVLSDGWSAA
jgi:hypothetical protein